MDRIFNPMIRAMRDLPKPIVAAVNGVAAGGGANLALACDIVMAARSARFDQAFVRISLIPDLGGTWFLPHTVGDARARALAMLGTSVPAEEAARMGMVWQVVDDAALMDEAGKIAARLATGPTRSYAAIKGAINARRHQHARPAARPRTRRPARARQERGLQGRRRGLPRQARPPTSPDKLETDDLREDPDRQGQMASPR